MRTVRLTRQLSFKELQVAIACGARDEVDFVAARRGEAGDVVNSDPVVEWESDRVLRWVRDYRGDVWLFEPIEDGEGGEV